MMPRYHGDPIFFRLESLSPPKAASTHLEVAPCFRCDLAALSDKHLAHPKVRGCGLPNRVVVEVVLLVTSWVVVSNNFLFLPLPGEMIQFD